MKKRKFNILLNIAVLCMCIAAIAIGVYSAKTASLNVSGTIGFTAHNCKVRVLGKITGAVNEKNVALDPANTPALNYQESADTGKLIDGKADKWDFGNIYFDDLNTDKYHEVNDIVFTFTITNESDYYVDVTVDQDCIKNNRLFIYAPNNGETLAPKDQVGSSVTLTVKLQLLKEKEKGEYSSLDLNSAINFSGATLLNFTKSQAPAYLAADWKDKMTTGFNNLYLNSITSISFLNKIDDNILNGFDKNNDGTYKTVSVGADSPTTNVSDIKAYYKSGASPEIVIYSPARIYAPQSCANMFMFVEEIDYDMATLAILDVSNFDTSKVTNMSNMFAVCSALNSLDVSNFDTSSVTNMGGMFKYCFALTSLDLSNFDTCEVTNMSIMFTNCSGLTSLDVSNFNTSNVTNMSYMFQSCSELTSLDVSNFNTSKVTDMSYMFERCHKLTSLDVSNFNTSKITNMEQMFHYCEVLTSLDVSNFDTSSVTNMNSMFLACSKLTSLDVSNFDTNSVTDMSSMFGGCSELTSLDLSNFNTSKVTDMRYMFAGCSAFTSLDLSNFNTSKVTDMSYMFEVCSKLTSLDLSNFNTSEVTYMSGMFYGCSALKTIYVNSKNWNTEKANSSSSMFSDCTNLVGGAGTIYDSSKTDKTYAKVDGGTSNPGYLTAKA